jgi:pimeloyl-ACP methyl ester carboxylesterase
MSRMHGVFAGMLALSGVQGAAGAGEPAGVDYSAYTQPQRMIEVAPGRRLNLVCMGRARAGVPTVVFEIGVGDPAGDWARVQPEVAKSTRACSYDRAGVGFSDPGTGDGSSAGAVADLRQLLVAADIPPPYLLVGQSSGGMSVRLFYYLHPDEVAGLVLVEPSHEEQDEGFRMVSARELNRADWVALREPGRLDRLRCIDAAHRGVDPASEAFKDCVVDAPATLPDAIKPSWVRMQYGEKFQRAQGAEELAVFDQSVAQLREHRRAFGDLPVIVLTRSPETRPLRDWETPHLREVRYRVWANLHQGLADSSSRGEHRVVPDSDHMMMLTQPGAVITAVADVLAMIETDRAAPGK